MMKYITGAYILGILWAIIFMAFPFITYKFIKRNPSKTIGTIMPMIVILSLFHVLASQLMGKTKYDLALVLIKDAWFLVGPAFLITTYLIIDKDLFNNLFKRNKQKV